MKCFIISCCLLLVAWPASADSRVRKSAGRRVWKVLTVASLGAAAADVHFTIQTLHDGGYETNPLARPLTNLPTPAYATLSMIGAAGVDWFGLKLQRSRHAWVRRFWWVPQVYQIQANTRGAIQSSHH
jgi:hypothetical protein